MPDVVETEQEKPELVKEPDLLSFEIWLASNPNEDKVERWLRAVEAFYMRDRMEIANV